MNQVQELGNSQKIQNGILHLLFFFVWKFVDVAEIGRLGADVGSWA